MAKQKERPSEEKMARSWLAITIRQFRGSIRKLKAVDSEELVRSFQSTVNAGPDSFKIQLVFARQGMYIDMGVGRGMPIGGARELGNKFSKYRGANGRLLRHVRKPKKWYSKTMSHETKRLAELVSDQKGQTLIANITQALPDSTKINF